MMNSSQAIRMIFRCQWLLLGGLCLAYSGPSFAQVIEDSSLPNPTTVDASLNIGGGTLAGDNLFHSFEQFSVPDGDIATFINPGVLNIIGRVTGSMPSDIDGTIAGSGDGFNLFLINPNGITFGPNSGLNLNGSLFISTAENVVFDNGLFSTDISTSTDPLLLVDVPTGLQVGASPSQITVQGGLFLPSGNTLGLLGGNVNIEGASLALTEGNIEIGSVGNNGRVTIEPGFQLKYDPVTSFQDITFSDQTNVLTSAGDINIYGRMITVEGGSGVAANPTGTGLDGGTLQVAAADTVLIRGGVQLTPTNFIPSGFFAQNIGGAGNAGNIEIQAPNVVIVDGGFVSNSTMGSGSGGTTIITADEQLQISGESSNGSPSGIFSEALGTATASGGNLTIDTGNLLIEDGARISVSDAGTVGAGNASIIANEVSLSNRAAVAGLTISGNGGNVIFDVEGDIVMRFNSLISAQSLGTADGGNIDFDVEGFILAVLSENSDVLAGSALGQGGEITGQARGIFNFREFTGVVTPESDFTAGLDGLVDVQTQESQPQQPLPQNLASRDIAEGCSAAAVAALNEGTQSSLQVVGNGGTPSQPSSPNSTNNLWIIPVEPVDMSEDSAALSTDTGVVSESSERRTVALLCAYK